MPAAASGQGAWTIASGRRWLFPCQPRPPHLAAGVAVDVGGAPRSARLASPNLL